MSKIFILFTILWLIWETKYILFWLFLWQLKDYHLRRFLDHFRTYKGKKLIVDFFQIIKLVLLILLLLASSLFNYLFFVAVLLYFAEALLFLKALIGKSFKKPVKTSKTLLLTATSLLFVVLFSVFNLKINFGVSFLVPLLGFDILTPIIISVIVLLSQPLFVKLRNRILDKAKDKMAQIKSVSGLKVVAITGSYGKTSTKEFLFTILSKKFKVLSTREHQNAEIGIAKCILDDLSAQGGPASGGKPYEIFIAEVGAYDKGKVKEVCQMLNPKIGIVTGVNEQHLALFGSLENLLSAEGGGELANSLPKDGMLVVNGDNKYCLNLYKKDYPNKKVYSLSNKIIEPDIWAEDIEVSKEVISFVAINKNKEAGHFQVNLLGKHSVQNLLGAILIAKELGMSFEEISEACKNISQIQGGMTLVKGKHGINIVDSSYSSNPDGVFADLDYLSVLTGKKVVVMPCLIELGEKSAVIHENIGKRIARVCDLAIITSKDKFREIKGGALEKGMAEKNIILCDNPSDIYSIITLYCKEGDAVLLEGRVPGELINFLNK